MLSKGVYIIAEIGPNHNGDVDLALEMVEKIAATGVDAIKFQLSDPYMLYSDDSFKANYQKANDNASSAREMSLSFQLSHKNHVRVYNRCKKLGVDYTCTAFDLGSLKFLDESFDLAFFKIASGEIFSLDTIDYIAHRNRPIVLSTGMATYDEIETSLGLLNKYSKQDITILHCISNYPAKYDEVNLMNMMEIKKRFGYEVGFSDHTIGNECAIAAVAMGAKVIEKHVTIDKTLPGPDHKASIDIPELASLVSSIRHIEQAIGVSERCFSEAQREIAGVARKSIVARHDMMAGHVICEDDICYKRPGIGFLPIEKDKVIGMTLLCDVKGDRVIKREFLK